MTLRIDILTLFPEMFAGPFDASIIARARASGAVEIVLHNPRDYAHDKHHVVDDYAYGGGPGMVMKPEPLFDCVDAVRALDARPARVVLLTPQGRLLDHAVAAELAAAGRLIIICGHYEGVDERVREHLADDEISIGDFVLSGGEPAAIVLTDAVARHQPGVLGSEQSLEEESHAQGLLEYPQYTRPPEYRGFAVPDVLLSGHHADVAAWRRRQSIARTARRRPDLLARATLTPAEQRWADEALVLAPAGVPRVRALALPCFELEPDVRFYAAWLGAPGERLDFEHHEFKLGTVTLSLIRSTDWPAKFALTVSVPDIKSAHERASAADPSEIDDRIRKQPDGTRGFAMRDPTGNRIMVVSER